MREVPLLAAIAVILAGCHATSPLAWRSPSASEVVVSPTAPPQRAVPFDHFLGSWTGATNRGESVDIVLEQGSSQYRVRGEPVQVTSAEMAGNALVLTVGSDDGRVALTPLPGGRLAYDYRSRSGRASAVLFRA